MVNTVLKKELDLSIIYHEVKGIHLWSALVIFFYPSDYNSIA